MKNTKEKRVYNKKRKMDVEETKPKSVDVTELVNKWMQAQKDICEVILSLVNKINELENRK